MKNNLFQQLIMAALCQGKLSSWESRIYQLTGLYTYQYKQSKFFSGWCGLNSCISSAQYMYAGARLQKVCTPGILSYSDMSNDYWTHWTFSMNKASSILDRIQIQFIIMRIICPKNWILDQKSVHKYVKYSINWEVHSHGFDITVFLLLSAI